MPARQLWLAAYDISQPSRLRAALQITRAHAAGGQKSVHEVWLTRAERQTMLDNLTWIIDPHTDRFLLIRLDARQTPIGLGRARIADDADDLYIG